MKQKKNLALKALVTESGSVVPSLKFYCEPTETELGHGGATVSHWLGPLSRRFSPALCPLRDVRLCTSTVSPCIAAAAHGIAIAAATVVSSAQVQGNPP